jgi:transposase-like protein
MPTFITVQCPHCHRDQVVNRGKTARGPPRDLCQKKACATGSCLLDSTNRGCLPEVQDLIIDMSLHASGIRDTARARHSSTDTVLSALKKKGTGIGVSRPHTAERAESGRGDRRHGASR